MQRGILKPKSAPDRCSHIEINPRHHSYFNGCLTGVFLTTTSYIMFDYFSLIHKGEYFLDAGTTTKAVWKTRLAERREWLAAHHRLHERCRRGEDVCNLCLRKQQENTNQRRLKEWVWRITEGALSENAPAWVFNRTLQIVANRPRFGCYSAGRVCLSLRSRRRQRKQGGKQEYTDLLFLRRQSL